MRVWVRARARLLCACVCNLSSGACPFALLHAGRGGRQALRGWLAMASACVIAVLLNIAAWAHGGDYRVSPDSGRSWREDVCEVAACRVQWRFTVLLFLAEARRKRADSGRCELRKYYYLCAWRRNTADALSHWRWPDVERLEYTGAAVAAIPRGQVRIFYRETSLTWQNQNVCVLGL